MTKYIWCLANQCLTAKLEQKAKRRKLTQPSILDTFRYVWEIRELGDRKKISAIVSAIYRDIEHSLTKGMPLSSLVGCESRVMLVPAFAVVSTGRRNTLS